MSSLLRIIQNFNLLNFVFIKTNFFFKLWQAGNQNSKTFKNDEVNIHIPVLDIAKIKSALISGKAEIRPWKKCNFIRNNAMWNGVLRVVPFKIQFLICFWSDHNEIAMGNAIYTGGKPRNYHEIVLT